MNSREMNRMVKILMGSIFHEHNPFGLEDWRGETPFELLKQVVLGKNYTEASEKRFEKTVNQIQIKVLGTLSNAEEAKIRKELNLE